MAKRHQFLQASLFGNRFNTKVESDTVVEFHPNMFNINVPSNFKFVSKKIYFLGTVYKANDIVLFSIDELGNIYVLIINSIIINTDYTEFLLYGSLLKMEYNIFTSLYESLSQTIKQFGIINCNKLLIQQPLKVLYLNHHYYFAPFCSIVEHFLNIFLSN